MTGHLARTGAFWLCAAVAAYFLTGKSLAVAAIVAVGGPAIDIVARVASGGGDRESHERSVRAREFAERWDFASSKLTLLALIGVVLFVGGIVLGDPGVIVFGALAVGGAGIALLRVRRKQQRLDRNS